MAHRTQAPDESTPSKPLKLKLKGILTPEEIHELAIVPAGTPLKQGAVYRDLMDSDLEPFTADGQTKAREDQWLIAKHETPYEIWNKVKGRFIH